MVPARGRRRPRSVLSVVGARPQFVKAAVIAQSFADTRWGRRHAIVHTGQHFDPRMSAVFFRELRLPRPAHALGLGGLEPAAQLGRMIEALARIFERRKPSAVIVYGDTTSTLAGGLAAALAGIPVAHVEAGLRSFNRAMPEELNRTQVDHLSRWLFCSSRLGARRLADEGIRGGVFVSGDVMVDALKRMRPATERIRGAVLARLGLREEGYRLVTIHRAENTREARGILEVLRMLGADATPSLLPLHPRTRKVLARSGFLRRSIGSLRIVEPVGYLEMLALEQGAQAILTDSGGVQKEAYFWGVPCVTLREETEWVETLDNGWNRLTGLRAERVRRALDALPRAGFARRPALYGDGEAGARIVQRLQAELE